MTVTSHGQAALPRLRREQARIITLCHEPVSLAEVAVSLRLPVGATQVLVSDLFDEGLLDVHEPSRTVDGRPDVAILRRLIAGLRAES